ncbi:MAG: hypothetical protein RR891_11235 [Clostridium sp.]|uniref:hypothetical protein n=1 Tax=Clostridium sp. TaxID=1506 RepID=UPI00302DD53A
MNIEKLIEFTNPYYENKDIMHNMWHIELMLKWVDKIISIGDYKSDYEALVLATYFHGFIYSDEKQIREWMKLQKYNEDRIEKIIAIAWESQRPEIPTSLEGKILHDAHVLEGGKNYLITKSLITGSVRGQTLKETIKYMEENILGYNHCYLTETIPLCKAMNDYSREFIEQLKTGIR